MRSLEVGSTEEYITRITDESNHTFARLAGDFNPVHFDTIRMQDTHFKSPIANGIQVVTAIGTAIVKMFVSDDTMVIATEQHNSFIKPVYIGQIITASITIEEAMKNDKYWIKALIKNEAGDIVISSRFKVKVLHA